MKKFVGLLASAFVAWLTGLTVIVLSLYFQNNAVDFTLTDIMGFAVLFLLVSGIVMLVLYLPGLLWLKRRAAQTSPARFAVTSGVLLNLPLFILLAFLIGRKMVVSEALLFMLAFLLSGLVFGFGFFLVSRSRRR
jgi:hypothetical protein